jgi:hypothetical protein
MYTHIYLHICVYTYMCICLSIVIHIYTYTYRYTYICIHIYRHIYVYLYVYICLYQLYIHKMETVTAFSCKTSLRWAVYKMGYGSFCTLQVCVFVCVTKSEGTLDSPALSLLFLVCIVTFLVNPVETLFLSFLCFGWFLFYSPFLCSFTIA